MKYEAAEIFAENVNVISQVLPDLPQSELTRIAKLSNSEIVKEVQAIQEGNGQSVTYTKLPEEVLAKKAEIIQQIVPQISEEKAMQLAELPSSEIQKAVEEIKETISEQPKMKDIIENDISLEPESIKQNIPEVLTTVVDTASEQTTLPKSVESIPEEPEKQFDFYVWLYDIFN